MGFNSGFKGLNPANLSPFRNIGGQAILDRNKKVRNIFNETFHSYNWSKKKYVIFYDIWKQVKKHDVPGSVHRNTKFIERTNKI